MYILIVITIRCSFCDKLAKAIEVSQCILKKKKVPMAKIAQVYITEINVCPPAPSLAESIPIHYELSLLIRVRGPV